MTGFAVDRVLETAVTAFAETIDVKLRQLRRFVPKSKDLTNPELTGGFIEEVVRGFIANWIGHRRLITGTLYSEQDALKKPMQIDGIVYDPTRGPTVLLEGNFGIVHPAFCDGIIEIKMTFKNYTDPKDFPGLTKLESKLDEMHQRYLPHLPSCHVMGVVIADDDPSSIDISNYFDVNNKPVPYNAFDTVPLKPIFILFRHNNGEFEPRLKDIENMLRAIYHLKVGQQYV